MPTTKPRKPDPCDEIERAVDAVILDHLILWGCDDPVCALRSSNLLSRMEDPDHD
jgi:hypothetical protein